MVIRGDFCHYLYFKTIFSPIELNKKMPLCVAIDCTNKSYRKTKGQENVEKDAKITFHRFPKEKTKKLVWIKAMGLCIESLPKSSHLCSLHFLEKDFDCTSLVRTRLRENSIPIPNISELGDRKEETDISSVPNTSVKISLTEPIHNNYNLTSSTLQDNETKTIEIFHCVSDKTPTEILFETSVFNNELTLESEATKIQIRHREDGNDDDNEIILKRKMHCFTFDDVHTNQQLEDTPRKKFMRKAIFNQKKFYQQQMQTLKQRNKRQQKRIAQLNTILKELKQKSLLTDEHADLLKTIGECNISLFKRFIANSNILINKKKPNFSKEYPPEIRKFALTLHYYSPKAYNYVRKHFNACLLHPKSISKWFKSINENPGFMEEALYSISKRVKATDYPLFGTLIFDEMSISQHIEYDGEKFSGYVDFGNEIINDKTNIVKDALVFLIVCMNAAWKVPVGYFLINGITAYQKNNLIMHCICLLHDTGVRVVGLTFDGTTTNFTTAKKLQCNLTPNCLQTWFPHPVTNEKLFIFLDPCHMIKLVRNMFGDLKIVVNGLKHRIKWQYIIDLYNLQKQESLHLDVMNDHEYFPNIHTITEFSS
ncbi:uncharacterized protein [Anoplolepis gracilipes]|uniref:uncharacterized protein n=1 Tax=Anoplolepis gracilipes TaxID=354296 RepID=UPI003B9F4183